MQKRIFALFVCVLTVLSLSIPCFAASAREKNYQEAVDYVLSYYLPKETEDSMLRALKQLYVYGADRENNFSIIEAYLGIARHEISPYYSSFESAYGVGDMDSHEAVLTEQQRVAFWYSGQFIPLSAVDAFASQLFASFESFGVSYTADMSNGYPVNTFYVSPFGTLRYTTLTGSLSEVVGLFPVVLTAAVSFLAIRKGLAFLLRRFRAS